MIIQRNNLLLTLLISASMTSCGPDEGAAAYDFKAKSYAGMLMHEIPTKYFNCYTLDTELKKQCNSDLSKKYISTRWQQVPKYVQTSQFEAEKLGFKY